MNNKELRKLLEQLHDEIGRTPKVDARGRELLQDLDGHIRELLARSEAASLQPRPAMVDGLEKSIRHFEVTHPSLTNALSNLLTALSNAGI